MSDEQIIAYVYAIRKREEAKKHFRELTEIVSEAGRRMTEEMKSATPGNPRVVHFSHGFGLNGGLVDAQTWPSADVIARARQDMLTAVAAAQSLWDRLPPELRHGLQPPNL